MKTHDPAIRLSTGEGGSGPRAVLRALDALKWIAAHPAGITLADLGRLVDVPKTSLLELLRALAQGDYIVNEGGLYRLGAASRALGTSLTHRSMLTQLARPFLERLALLCGEGASLVEISGSREVLYRDFVECRDPLQFRIQVGQLAPLHCSSSGLAIMAFRSEEEQQAFLADAPFQRFASGTPTTAKRLTAVMSEARRTMVCTTENSLTEGVLALASPIFDADGSPCAAIGLVGPAFRVAPKMTELRAQLTDHAARLSEMLGFPREAGDRHPARRA